MTPAEQTAHVRRYFGLLNASDIDGIIALFAEDAYVVSPFLGRMGVPEFFRKLGNASDVNSLVVFDVLLSVNGDSAAAHFEYDWTLKSGERVVFQGIDYFRFSGDGRFASLTIFYDTHPVREDVGDKYGSA